MVTPDEHREYKIKAATYGVTVADFCRLALADDSKWRKNSGNDPRIKITLPGPSSDTPRDRATIDGWADPERKALN